VPALIEPGVEVGVVVLAAGFEEVRVVRDEHGGDAAFAQRPRDGVLPDLYRPPGPPQEVQRPDQDVVAGRHARQRSGMVAGESQSLFGEAVDVRGCELRAAVCLEQVPVKAVEKNDNEVLRLPWAHEFSQRGAAGRGSNRRTVDPPPLGRSGPESLATGSGGAPTGRRPHPDETLTPFTDPTGRSSTGGSRG
jgi:hypothetical protein